MHIERKGMSGPGNAGFPELVWKKFQDAFPELGENALEKFKEMFYCEVTDMWSDTTRTTERVMQELAQLKLERLERKRKRQAEEEGE
jgi:hypothetical protein